MRMCVDGLGLREVDDHPLRMRGVRFAGEFAGQIRIALPVSGWIAVGHARILVLAGVAARGSAVGDPVSIRLAQKVLRAGTGFGAAHKITALMRSVAPCAVGVPMPRVVGELGILPVGNGAPASRETGFDNRLGIYGVEVFGGENIHRGAHGFVGVEGNGLARAHVYMDGLRLRSASARGDGEDYKECGK